MARSVALTFEEGCNKYLENCRQRNLREGTINHYRQSYLYFYKFFDPKMPIEDIDEQTYKDYVLHLKSTLDNDTSSCSRSDRRGFQIINLFRATTAQHRHSAMTCCCCSSD